MFIRASTILFSVAALAGLVAAAPADLEVRQQSCQSGTLQCCQETQSVSSPLSQGYFGYYGYPIPSSASLLGYTCSPITYVGSGSGAKCTTQAVCCQGNVIVGQNVMACNNINGP